MAYDVSIIIPFLNEADNIPELIRELKAFSTSVDFSLEVLLVDDGSTDNSVELIQAQPREGLPVTIISLSRNFGSHAALRAGIEKATGRYIGFLYADLQDKPVLIKEMFELAEGQKNQIVWAKRKSTDNGFVEKAFSYTYAWLMKNYVDNRFPSKGFDVVLFDRQVQAELNKNIESNSSIFLQILTMGFSQGSLEYDKFGRAKGKSKWTLGKKIKAIVDSFVAFSFFPIRLVSITGILFFIVGILWTVYIVIRKLALDDLETGWPALVSILMIGFGITNISLGIIAEYLWRTLDSSRKRPVFIVDEVIDLKNKAS